MRRYRLPRTTKIGVKNNFLNPVLITVISTQSAQFPHWLLLADIRHRRMILKPLYFALGSDNAIEIPVLLRVRRRGARSEAISEYRMLSVAQTIKPVAHANEKAPAQALKSPASVARNHRVAADT